MMQNTVTGAAPDCSDLHAMAFWGRHTMARMTDADWILKTMAAMAAADQRLDAREVSLIQKVYLAQTGEPVDIAGVYAAVQMYARHKNILAELGEIAGSLEPATKEAIIRSAYLTLACNGHVTDDELTKLEGVASALRVSGHELKAIMDATEID